MIPLVRPVTEPEFRKRCFGNDTLDWSLSPAKRLHMAKLHTQSQRDEHQEEEDGEQLRHPLELADGRRV